MYSGLYVYRSNVCRFVWVALRPQKIAWKRSSALHKCSEKNAYICCRKCNSRKGDSGAGLRQLQPVVSDGIAAVSQEYFRQDVLDKRTS